MTIEEVKIFIEENKESEEVKSYLDSFKVEPTLEVFKEKITNDGTFKSFMDSEKDLHHSKALETWRQNNLQSLVDEKIKTLYPQDDPKDLEMKKLQQQIEQMQKDTTRKELTNLALKQASEKKLPTELIDFFVSNDEETTLANLENFEKVFNSSLESQLKAKLQGNGDTVPGGNGGEGTSYGARLAKQNADSNKDSQDKQGHYFK